MTDPAAAVGITPTSTLKEYFSADPTDHRPAQSMPIPSVHSVDLSQTIVRYFNAFALLFAAACLSISLYLLWPSETIVRPSGSHRVWAAPMVFALISSMIVTLRVLAGDSFARRRRLKATSKASYRRQDTDVHWLPLAGLSIERIAQSFKLTNNHFSKTLQATALSILLEPSNFTTRIGHSIDSEAQTLIHDVTRRVESRDGFRLNSCPIPVHKEHKGRLSHRFSINIDNTRNSTLTSVDGLALTLTLLTSYVDRYLHFVEPLWTDADWLTILTAINSESPVRPESRLLRIYEVDGTWNVQETERRFSASLTRIKNRIVEGGSTAAEAEAVIQLITNLAQNYVVWAVMPHKLGQWSHVTTGYSTRLDIIHQKRYERGRVSYGLASRSVVLPLEMSREAQSYHLHLTVPDETYVYGIRVTLSQTQDEAPESGSSKSTNRYPEVRGEAVNPVIRTSRSGSNVAHVYTRGAGSLVSAKQGEPASVPLLLSAHFEFREIPPGNLVWAILISFYIAGLAWAVNFYYSLVFPADPKSMTTVWTTLIFGLPAILAGFLISRFTKDNLKQSSFVTLGLLASCIANAFLVICVAVLSSHHKWNWTWDFRLSYLWKLSFDFSAERTITYMPWAVMVIISTTNLLLALSFTYIRRRRYTARTNREA